MMIAPPFFIVFNIECVKHMLNEKTNLHITKNSSYLCNIKNNLIKPYGNTVKSHLMYKVFYNSKVESNEVKCFSELTEALTYVQNETEGKQIVGVSFDDKDTASQFSYTVYDGSIEDAEEMLENPVYETLWFFE